MPTYPQTVDGIVAELKRRGATFHVTSLGFIRSARFHTSAGWACCPLEVLAGRIDEPSIPENVRQALMNAADGVGYNDAAVRAQLLTLCQG